MIVSNTGNRAGTVKLYSADGSTGQTTGTVYLTDSKPVHAGAWVKLAQPSVKLAPGEIKHVPFTVQVPAPHVEPGQWVAGIVAETATSAKTKRSTRKAGVQIRIRNQTIIAVQVNVPGTAQRRVHDRRRQDGRPARLPAGARPFLQRREHAPEAARLRDDPPGRQAIEHLPFKMDTFLPQTAIDYPVLLKKALARASTRRRLALLSHPGRRRKTITASPTLKISDENVKQVFTSAAPQQPPGGVVADSGSSTPWALIARRRGSRAAAPARGLAAPAPSPARRRR